MVETMTRPVDVPPPKGTAPAIFARLAPAFARLDQLLQRAVAAADDVYAAPAAGEAFRGLYISEGEVARLLARPAGESLLYAAGDGAPEASGPLAKLRDAFGLEAFDLDVILLALAPEIDRRYERLFGYLQDNVSLRRPTVDLALHLLCANAEERLRRRSRFEAEGALAANHVLHVLPDGPYSTLLSAALKLDDQVVAFILGDSRLDARLAPYATRSTSPAPFTELPVTPETRSRLERVAAAAVANGAGLVVFEGADAYTATACAQAIAASLRQSLLEVDLSAARAAGEGSQVLIRARQVAALFGSPVFLNSSSAPAPAESAPFDGRLLRDWPGLLIATASAGAIDGAVRVQFEPLEAGDRLDIWRQELARHGLVCEGEDIVALAGRLPLRAGEIIRAVMEAVATAGPDGDVLARASQAASRGLAENLGEVARRIHPRRTWSDIVLPPDTLAQLEELCARARSRDRVIGDWGFGRRLTLGTGTPALFAGPPGTGKTLAAEIVSAELKLDLFKVDLSAITSKYIGETEKNVARVFAAAERANAVLFFDEADALFGKRSEVRDSHDRYANVEVSYLLQRIEEYEGVAILATNLRQNLDDSFVRRLSFIVHFPFPDEAHRERIWRSIWPPETPIEDGVDFGQFARTYRLAGGNIKNIALAAAFLAAAQGSPITHAHLLHATQREYQKLGATMPAAVTAVHEGSAP